MTGPIPKELLRHPRFSQFKTGLAKPTGLDLDEINVPDVNSRFDALKKVILPVLLGYADLVSDLQTAFSYYKSNHFVWCVLVLIFALTPSVVLSIFYLSRIRWERRVLVALQLSLLVEAGRTVKDEIYSPVVALLRVVEPLLEAVPQLLLQLYVMLRVWNEEMLSSTSLVFRVASVCMSAVSLAYAATDLSSVEKLKEFGSDFPTGGFPCWWCGGITGLIFSRVPAHGESPINNCFGEVHVRTHVWLCFMYHLLEIFCRFVPLAMLLLVMRGWFCLVLVYLWVSRSLLVSMAADITNVNFKFRVRLVAMPFLDSIMDGTKEFGVGVVLTFLEFVACIAIYNAYGRDILPFPVLQRLAQVAIFAMVGKLVLALAVILPLKIRT